MKIRKKITITFMAIMLLTLLIVSLVSYIIVKNIVTRNALQNLESISTAQLNHLENINEQNLERLKLVSSRTQLRINLQEYNRNPEIQDQIKINKILNDSKSHISDFKEISIINLDGVIIASTNEESIGTEHLNKDYFLRGKKENITNLFFLDKDMNLNIHLSGPLILDNELLGILLITASGDKITNFVTDYSLFGETGYTFLVVKADEQNKFLTFLRRVRGKPTKYAYINYDDFGQISKKVIEKQKGTYKILYDYLNEPMSAVVNYSDKLEIGFSVRLSREEILKPAIRYGNLLVVISILSLLIMFINTSLSARSITKPILKLTNLTKEISEGDLDQKIEISSKDEIGILSKAFNTMADNLKQDINARKQAEEELKQHRDHLEELVKERTKELEEKTAKLEKSQQSLALLLKDVNESRKELDKTNKELKEKTSKIEESQKSLTLLLEDVNESRAELDISNKKLDASNKELEAFSYSVSHDLRAPLRAIDGFSQILLDDYSDVLDKQAKHYLDRVRAGSQNMGKLIDDLLNLSRIGRRKIIKNDTNIENIVKDVYKSLKDEYKNRKIEFKINKCPSALADTNLLKIVFTNLLSNAVKFTGKKKIAVIEVGSELKDEQTVFYVKDNGVGFNMNYADKLFSPFQRLHGKDEFEGTGIGLAIVRRIIARHGGNIWVKSKLGKGTIFYFTLGE